jgi:hypothetical protein
MLYVIPGEILRRGNAEREKKMTRIVPCSGRRIAPAQPNILEAEHHQRRGEHGNRRRGRGWWLASLALCVLFLGLLPAARAELLVYSATDFVRRCPSQNIDVSPT